MARLIAKNWGEFQHYKDRSPAWIKLHKTLIDDFEYQCLPLASRALAPMLWLIASEYSDGAIEYSPAKIAFRLRVTEQDVIDAVKPLIDAGFFILDGECYQHASKPLAERLPREREEREIEIEKEEEKKEKRAPRFDALAHLVSIGVDSVIASDWIKHRQTLKAAPTLTAINGIETEAARAGISLANALAMCCQRGWRGFKAEWVKQEHANKPAYKSATDDRREFMAALTGKKPQQPAIVDLNVIDGESRHVA